MKALFYRYRNICEVEISEAFHDIGIDFIELVAGNDALSELSRLKETIDDVLPDFVFSIDFFPLVSDVCNIYHIRYISWIVDCPVMELYFKQISNNWNRVFIFDKMQYEEVKVYNPEKIFYFPLAAGINSKKRLFERTDYNKQNLYAHDIAFVGSLYTEISHYDDVNGLKSYDKGYLDGVMRAQEKIYGAWILEELLDDYMVEEFKTHHPTFYELEGDSYLTDKITMTQLYMGSKISAMEREDTLGILSEKYLVNLYTMSDSSNLPLVRNMGAANSVTEMPLIFKNSKINLNITSKSIRTGLPQRIFDIMSCGGFVLSNYQTEIMELFDVGNEIVVYDSMDDLMNKCEYYLTHEKERKEIAEAGFRAVEKNYTYQRRIPQMIIKAFEI